MKSNLYGFLFVMWVLIIFGGGIIVIFLGPISISGYDESNWLIGSIIKGKPVEHTADFKLKSTNDKTAPVTLVRLILSSGPLSEKQVGFVIFKLAIFSGILAIITAFLMGVSL